MVYSESRGLFTVEWWGIIYEDLSWNSSTLNISSSKLITVGGLSNCYLFK